MADKKDDEVVAWNELDADDEQRFGVSKDVLRKLMQMNPALRGGKSTEDLLQQVKSTMKDGAKAPMKDGAKAPMKDGAKATATGPAKAPQPSHGVNGEPPGPALAAALTDALARVRAEFEAEAHRLDVEQKRLTEARAALHQKSLGVLLDRCAALDPGLNSPALKQLLQQERAFLERLGLTPQKLSERQRRAPR